MGAVEVISKQTGAGSGLERPGPDFVCTAQHFGLSSENTVNVAFLFGPSSETLSKRNVFFGPSPENTVNVSFVCQSSENTVNVTVCFVQAPKTQ